MLEEVTLTVVAEGRFIGEWDVLHVSADLLASWGTDGLECRVELRLPDGTVVPARARSRRSFETFSTHVGIMKMSCAKWSIGEGDRGGIKPLA